MATYPTFRLSLLGTACLQWYLAFTTSPLEYLLYSFLGDVIDLKVMILKRPSRIHPTIRNILKLKETRQDMYSAVHLCLTVANTKEERWPGAKHQTWANILSVGWRKRRIWLLQPLQGGFIRALHTSGIYSPPKQRRGMAERKENSAHVEIIDERGRKSFQCKICRRRLWSCRYVHFFPFVLIYLFSKGYFSWYWFIWILLFSIGRTHPFPDGHPDADFLKQNFGLVNLDVIRQVPRVVKCSQRFFSFIYKRMKRRMCFTVLLKDRIVGAIQYFVLNQSTRNVHAVITRYNIGVPSFLDTIAGGNHLTSVKVDENPT